MDPGAQTNIDAKGPTNAVEISHVGSKALPASPTHQQGHPHWENSTSDAAESKVSALPTSVDILPTETGSRKAQSSQDKEARRPNCSCPWESDDDSESSSDSSSDDGEYHFKGAVPRGEWNCTHQHKHRHGIRKKRREEKGGKAKARRHVQGCPCF
ncbi:hypothetical protein NLJ89_g5386 [Agrocybe chaxingu]|uniref:Uncharacterized protein n=1 Tax=Agrocybe chaxingu TaxID=84603 RepID=A0A9W8K0W5_9AGAR|nr:hypothetical protein NLJ89_g5386 [Agrocybe chaxingu]